MINPTARPIVNKIAGAIIGELPFSGSAGVGGLFSVDLGTGARTVSNGINLSGEGGTVWSKSRDTTESHQVYDTERGVTEKLSPDSTAAEATDAQGVTAFNSDGFTLGTSVTGSAVSWTFRKAAKFHDVITYAGNSNNNRKIPHDLTIVPGMVIVRNLATSQWAVQHIDRSGTDHLFLDTNVASATGITYWNNTDADADEVTLGTDSDVNATGSNYVMYVFAHDSEASGVIQCAGYTGTGVSPGPIQELNWDESLQFVMIRRTNGTGNWLMFDTTRGIAVGDDARLRADLDGTESLSDFVELTATGFRPIGTGTANNANGSNYIYIAIRAE